MKKNANGSGPARRDPLPDRSAERADRRNRRRLEDGNDGPRIVTPPRDDLRNLELHREWVAPGQARHRRMRRRRRLLSALVLIVVLAALAVAVTTVGRALGWFGGPAPTGGRPPSSTPSSAPDPSPLPAD